MRLQKAERYKNSFMALSVYDTLNKNNIMMTLQDSTYPTIDWAKIFYGQGIVGDIDTLDESSHHYVCGCINSDPLDEKFTLFRLRQ